MQVSIRAAIISLLIFFTVVLLIYCLHTFLAVDRAMEAYELDKESARLASNLLFSKMTAIAQVSVAVIAAAWTLLLIEKVQVRLEGASSITCFTLANLTLAASLLTYGLGYDFIVERIFHHGAFDIDAPFVTAVRACQQLLFLLGITHLIFSVYFGRRHIQ